jgi:preprotein translocase subunit YajC
MNLSLIIAVIVIVAGVLFWISRSKKKEASRFDDLHITGADKRGEK